MKDIDLSGANFMPIGTQSAPFAGTFDGDVHKVTNLTINSSDNYHGLFGYVDKETIKNIAVTGFVSGNSYVSGIARNINGVIIQNCYSEATVIGSYWVSGVAGYTWNNRKSLIDITPKQSLEARLLAAWPEVWRVIASSLVVITTRIMQKMTRK